MKKLLIPRFLYAHPTLALLLPLFPAMGVGFGLIYFDILSPISVAILLAWILLLLALPVRSAFRVLMQAARAMLERECDAEGCLALLRFMQKKKQLPPSRRASLDVHYCVALGAAGHTAEACEWAEACLQDGKHGFPIDRLQLYLTYACAAGEYEPKRHLLPTLISEMDRIVASLPLPMSYVSGLYDAIESAREIHRYHEGEIGGLRDRLVKRIKEYGGAAENRANRTTACLWLGRVYEREGSVAEARAMYTYVTEHGGTLGIVAEAKAALARLSAAAQ